MTDLFPATPFISAAVASQLPAQGFRLRPLRSDDYRRGFLAALSDLTTAGSQTESQFQDRFWYLKSHAHEYFIVVIEDVQRDRIAAAGTIFVERKFVHDNGLVGHIEDIVVHHDYRKLQFGRIIIEQLKHIGSLVGAYKIILDCSEKNVPFYEKCGFKQKEVEMVLYLDSKPSAPASKL